MSVGMELVEQHHRAFNKREWTKAAELYHADLVMVEPAGTTRGIEAFLQHAKGFVRAFPDSRVEIMAIIDAGDRVVVEGAYTGTNTGPLGTPQGDVAPTGRPMVFPYCGVFTLAAGRVVEYHVYYDQMSLATQLGLIPEQAGVS